MRLIPGLSIAPSIIASIDANHDGIFSATQKHDYARQLLADLAITVDGKSLRPTLLSWTFPHRFLSAGADGPGQPAYAEVASISSPL